MLSCWVVVLVTLNMKNAQPMDEHYKVRSCFSHFFCRFEWLMISLLTISFCCDFGCTESGSQFFMKKCPLVCIYSSIVCCVNGHANWHSTNNLEGIGTKPVKLACARKSWLSQPINLLLKLVVTELWLPKEVQMMMNVNWSWVPTWLHPYVFFFWYQSRYCCSVAIILRENWQRVAPLTLSTPQGT